MSALSCAELMEHFPDELAGVVGALSEVPTTAAPGTEAPGVGYLVTLGASDGGEGTLYVHVDHDGAELLARRVLGSSDTPSESAVLDALKDMCAQAAAAIVERRQLGGVRISVDAVEIIAKTPADAKPSLAEIAVEGDAVPARLALWGTLALGDADLPSAATPLPRAAALAASSDSPDVDVILDMELPLVVRFGRTEMTLKALTSLAPGAVIDLGRSPDDPVEVLVSNKVVARGEVVTVSGSYGVRITDIISPSERARYMEVTT